MPSVAKHCLKCRYSRTELHGFMSLNSKTVDIIMFILVDIVRNWLLRCWTTCRQLRRSGALRGPPLSFVPFSKRGVQQTAVEYCSTCLSIFQTQYLSRHCHCLKLNVTEGERGRNLECLLENIIEYVTKWSRVFLEKLIIVSLQFKTKEPFWFL
jgi:hypothetical protein